MRKRKFKKRRRKGGLKKRGRRGSAGKLRSSIGSRM